MSMHVNKTNRPSPNIGSRQTRYKTNKTALARRMKKHPNLAMTQARVVFLRLVFYRPNM